MAMQQFEQVDVANRAELREWLAANHDLDVSRWLIRYKKSVPDKYIVYEAIVEELLCWGWIDSLPRKLDDQRSLLLISPRRSKSPWSRVNKNHIKRACASGAMTDVGLAKIAQAKADGSWSIYDEVEDLIIPPDLADALAVDSVAKHNFHAFSDSSKKGILWWIKSAKRAATREKRIKETVRLAAENIKANHPR